MSFPTSLTSEHSNEVLLVDQTGYVISQITYLANSLGITQGQPSSPPPSIVHDGNTFQITLEAGREAAPMTATNFYNTCGGANHEYDGATTTSSGPGDLNFYFGVVLELQVNGQTGNATVYLGQGSTGLSNNWWIGGECILVSNEECVFGCLVGDQVVRMSIAAQGDNEFFLNLLSVSPFSPIKNVFVLMLENHSFDNIFALSGIPGIYAATTSNSNSYNDITYPVEGGAPASMPSDPGHEFTDVVVQLAGWGATYPSGGPYPSINNSGFAANYATTTTEGPPPPAAAIGDIMACFNTASELPVIYELATQFALCDQWFSSLPGPTWPNRYFVHGASSAGLDHSPTNEEMFDWEVFSGFVYPNGSIYDAFKAPAISFALYIDTSGPLEGAIAQVASIQNLSIFNVRSVSDFVSDLQNNYPYQYTFIEPNYGDVSSGSYENGSSQHPMDGVAQGEQLIQTVYEAIRNSSVWESSLLIITYDEHGGFYDHYAPGGTVAPGDNSSGNLNEYGFNFEQLGVRVPAVIVSPWIAQGVIDHTVYDHSSVLATVEKLLGVKTLTQRDANANNVLHLISDTLRTECPTSLPRPALTASRPAITEAQRLVLDQRPLPEKGNIHGFLGIMLKTELELSAGTPVERAAIIAKFQTIKTRGDARAYIQSVMARVEAVKAARKNQ